MKIYIAALLVLLVSGTAFAAAPDDTHTLHLTIGQETRSLTATALLANPQTRDVTIENDGAYHKAMHFKAIPLTALLAGMTVPPDAVLEAVAADGFVATLPLDLALHPQKGAAEALLAIEPPDAPWPALDGKKASAGPFYVVWQHPAASGIRSEQWPYMVVALRTADSPAKRWPALAVDPALPAGSPIRAGQALFATQCMACHKLNGAGSADVGPDLNLPENPTQYFKEDALRKYIRNPSSLRHWKAMQMPGFDKDALSDHEIDLIIAYLNHMAARKQAAH